MEADALTGDETGGRAERETKEAGWERGSGARTGRDGNLSSIAAKEESLLLLLSLLSPEDELLEEDETDAVATTTSACRGNFKAADWRNLSRSASCTCR